MLAIYNFCSLTSHGVGENILNNPSWQLDENGRETLLGDYWKLAKKQENENTSRAKIQMKLNNITIKQLIASFLHF